MYCYHLKFRKNVQPVQQFNQNFMKVHGWGFWQENEKSFYLICPIEAEKDDIEKKVNFIFGEEEILECVDLVKGETRTEKIFPKKN